MENMLMQNSRVAKINDMPVYLDEIMKDIRQGSEILLTDHDRIIAKIIPFSARINLKNGMIFSKKPLPYSEKLRKHLRLTV